jgi:UDP-N-acetyl-D-glucosamine dehydrogenase
LERDYRRLDCKDKELKIKLTAFLRRQILSRKARIAVIGQGYVGLSLGCAAAEAGFAVTGIDVDVGRIEDLEQGVLSVPGVRPDIFHAGVATQRIAFTTQPDALESADITFICVPTPVKDHTPDLSFVEGACKDVALLLRPGQLVVLESTTYPGTTDELVKPLLEKSGLIAGRDFLLAYSPERIDPGSETYDFRNTPRVVGGVTPEATGVAALFYSQLVEEVAVVSSCRSAELAKLLENTFRHVNVALVNEMAMLCHELGIDVWEVIQAASSKPFGFMPFYPGPGVGGHCIPLDPMYLAWQVRRDAGHQFRILEQAQDINSQMPAYVATRIGDALNDRGKAVNGASVLVLGVTYKPEVGDMRESPSLNVMNVLHKRGAKLAYHDPFIESLDINGLHLERTELTHRVLAHTDCVALLTPHQVYDLEWIAEHAGLVFDARNAYGSPRRTGVVSL